MVVEEKTDENFGVVLILKKQDTQHLAQIIEKITILSDCLSCKQYINQK